MQNYNTSITSSVNKTFNLKTESPTEVDNFIHPIIDVSPQINVIRSVAATNNTSATVYTTPADKDFYLCGFMHGYIKDATSTSDAASLRVTIDGATRWISYFPGITLTAAHNGIACVLAKPIKIDRNTGITVNNSTAVANVISAATIWGYTQETTMSSNM